MKKKFLWLVLFCCAALAISVNAAADYTVGDWTYTVSDGLLWLKQYSGADTVVDIPSQAVIDGNIMPLRGISDSAFAGNRYLTSVTVPEGVVHMGNSVFSDCQRLSSATIASTVTKLGACLFKNCTSLSQVTINGDLADCDGGSTYNNYSAGRSVFYNAGTNADSFTVTFGPSVTRIPAYLFATAYGKSDNVYPHLTAVNVPEGLKSIGDYAFYNCYSLPDMAFYGGLEQIGAYAFANCDTLKSVTFYDGLDWIGAHAFENCSGLNSITLPASLNKLHNCVFKNCTSLSQVTINGDLADCDGGSTYNNYSADRSVFYNAGTNAGSFTVTFGPSVTRIPAYLFATAYAKSDNVYPHLTAVNVPKGLKSIGDFAFYNCYSLPDVAFYGGLEQIGTYAFANCDTLKSVTFYDGLDWIGAHAFENCSGLNSVTLPASLNKLHNCVFKNCTGLSQVTINGDLADCDGGSTYNNYSADRSVFYNAGTNAGSFTVTFGPSVTRIPAYLFATAYGKSDNVYPHLTAVNVPKGLKSIGDFAFYNCYSLPDVAFYGGLEQIGTYAFANCDTLKSVTFYDGLDWIGAHAFENCSGLNSVTLPASLNKLHNCVFKNCTGLSQVTINGDLADCDGGSTYNNYSADRSVFYNAGTNAGSFTVTFGPSVTRIPAYLFATAYAKSDRVYAQITSVVIPSTVTEIGNAAFYNCYGLKEVIYDGVEQSWHKISIAANNDSLTALEPLYYNAVPRELEIKRITVRDAQGDSVIQVPTGSFQATVTVKNNSSSGNAVMILAAYTGTGQMKDLLYISIRRFPGDAEFDVTVPVDNASGEIVRLKAFTTASLDNMVPLSDAVIFE